MRHVTKVIRTAVIAAALTLTLHSPASAGNLCGYWIFPPCEKTPPSAPEIDPNLLRGAVAVLAGGVMMLAGRRRSH